MNSLEIHDIPPVCRCCLSQPLNLNDIFKSSDDGMDIAKAIEDICGFVIEADSVLPSKICDDCLKYLKSSYIFRTMSQQSNKTLQNILLGGIICSENDHNIASVDPGFIETKKDDKVVEETKEDDIRFTIQSDQNSESDVDNKSDNECPYCFKQILHKKTLRNHIERHLRQGKHCCSHCTEIFHTRFRLKSHLKKVHSEGVFFPCSLCDKEFLTNSECNRHIKSHLADKEFSCPHCGMLFKQKHNLQQHIQVLHEKKKNHLCGKCGKGFAFPCKLKQHQKSKCSPSIHFSVLKDEMIESNDET